MKQIIIVVTGIILSMLLPSCASFFTNNEQPLFNKSFEQCATFKISGDNVIFKNMSIYAEGGYLYFKTSKIQDPSGIRVYAVAKDKSLVLTQQTIINNQSDFTLFKTGEGFANYALKSDTGGTVFINCTQ